MSLTPGTRLGVYEITAQIGEGGMGQVFRATDTKLKRQVAIKILPPTVAADAERLARFQREAEVLASLNHPNVAAIYGLEESAGLTALVMELVEGEDLSQRIARGAIPIDEALPIAKQIADALEAAHEQGIIHRDLKPANIKVRSDGMVKVLDFGLAKAMEPAARSSPSVSMSPTLSIHATQAGIILGTAAYMSPEQAAGKPVDKRSDVWSFGVVLWEMLSGRRLFDGETISHTLADVLRAKISFAALPSATPSTVVTLMERCLTRDSRSRLRDIGEARVTLQQAIDHPEVTTLPPVRPMTERPGWLSMALVGAALLTAVLAVGYVWLARSQPVLLQVSRFFIPSTPENPLRSGGGASVRVSADGTRIIYLGLGPGGKYNAYYTRRLDELESKVVPGTELPQVGGVSNPFLSPDGRTLVFRQPGVGIVRVPLAGGTASRIFEDQPRDLGGVWAADDTLIFGLGDGLFRATASGGTLERLTGPEADTTIVRSPTMLPGGRVVLFSVIDATAQAEHVDALDLKTRRRVRVVDAGSEPKYLSPYLLFARGRNLMATAFDPVGLGTSGEAATVQPDVQRALIGNPLIYDVSPNGTLAYVPFGVGDQGPSTAPPVFVDRKGAVVGQIQGPIEQPIALDLSPDGQRLALVGNGAGNNPLWIYDLRDRPPLRLADRGLNEAPLWSPDGRTVVFSTNVTGAFDIYSLPSDGSVQQAARFGGVPPPTIKGIATRSPEDWLPDGRLVFSARETGNQSDLFASASPQGHGPTDLVKTSFGEYGARVSPDGRWLAFVSDRSGEPEVWVQPVSGGAAVRVSRAGGVQPLWSRNKRELFYRQGPAVMAVAVQPSNDFQFSPAMELFEGQYLLGVGPSLRTWDVTADGRFIMIPLRPRTTPPPQTGIVVVQNFSQEVKRLLGAK